MLPLFDSIREFCFKLGENVIEDVRMHRVVFCKSMTFRWFLDVEPEKGGVKIKIQKSRKDPIQIIQIKTEQNISQFTGFFKVAYQNIHLYITSNFENSLWNSSLCISTFSTIEFAGPI